MSSVLADQERPRILYEHQDIQYRIRFGVTKITSNSVYSSHKFSGTRRNWQKVDPFPIHKEKKRKRYKQPI
jgi:hypothetical protein